MSVGVGVLLGSGNGVLVGNIGVSLGTGVSTVGETVKVGDAVLVGVTSSPGVQVAVGNDSVGVGLQSCGTPLEAAHKKSMITNPTNSSRRLIILFKTSP